MRILVLSDSHGDSYSVMETVEKHRSAAVIVHLGDGEDDLYEVEQKYPEKVIHKVRGNCDFGSLLPYKGLDIVENKRIFFTHGHVYHVKHGLSDFMFAALDHKADIALFGHTHKAEYFYEDGLYVMNPGSISHCRGRTSYGIIDITPAGIVCNIVKVKK